MEFQDLLDRYYTVSEDQQAAVRKTIRHTAAEDPSKFIEALNTIDLETDEHLPVIYEALAEDTEKWSAFFLEEAQRILAAAEKTQAPYPILSLLDDFVFIDLEQFSKREELVALLKRLLRHVHPTFRYFAVNLLPDFMHENDDDAIKLLREMLHDKDWRVRHWALENLRDIEEVPERYRQPLMDKLRAKFSDPMKFD